MYSLFSIPQGFKVYILITYCLCIDYRWVCKDFPDLQLAVDNNILSDFDPNEYVAVLFLFVLYGCTVEP